MFNCTDHKTRLEHFHEWLDYYHSELDRCVSNFGLKINYVYPKNQLDVDMKRYSRLLFGLSILLATVCTVKPEDAGKIKEAMEMKDLSESFRFNDFDQNHVILYKTRIHDLIDSYLEFGLL